MTGPVPPGAAAGTDRERAEWAAISGLLAALTARGLHDPARHAELGDLVERVAWRMGCDAAARADAVKLAAIHDIGLLGVADGIVHADHVLDDAERAALCHHPRIAAAMLESIAELEHLASLVEGVNEQWDGHGYPHGLSGEAIPVPCRIVLACDAYGAMRRARLDRPALSDAVTRATLRRNAGTQFCPATVAALLAELEGVAVPTAAAPPEDVSERAVSVPAARAVPRRPSSLPPRLGIATYVVAAAVGAAIGLWWALPLRDVGDRCPPPGEGRDYCVLQKSILPGVVEVLVVIVACLLLASLVFVLIPRWRRGELRRRVSPWPTSDDATLAAASWMLTDADAHPPGGELPTRRP